MLENKVFRNPPLWLQASIIFLLAILIRLPGYDHTPIVDEYFHYLAAQSWIDNGTFAIYEGEYLRAALFTKLVGLSFDLFWDSFAIGRLPALLAGALWVLAVFLWTRKFAGTLSAWIAAMLFCFDPVAIMLSQYLRFYSLHGLAFWIFATCVYVLVTQTYSKVLTAVLSVVAISAFLLAWNLQVTTLIGLGALVVWFGIAKGPALTRKLLTWLGNVRAFWLAIVVLAVGAVLLIQTNSIEFLWYGFIGSPAYLAEYRGDILYYARYLLTSYTVFLIFLPVATYFAYLSRPKLTLFCITLFLVAFVLHSFAGAKAPRYFYYSMPFLFVIWGIFLASVIPVMLKQFRNVISKAAVLKSVRQTPAWFGVSVVLFLVVFGNTGYVWTAMTATGLREAWQVPDRWGEVVTELKPFVESVDVVVATKVMPTLYHLGRYDFHIVRDLTNTEFEREFTVDYRTGKRVISTTESLRKILECYRTGLFVTTTGRWSNLSTEFDDDPADLLVALAEEVPLPANTGIKAYIWDHTGTERQPSCEALEASYP